MNVEEFLSDTGYISINRNLIKKIGLVKATILSNLISKRRYFRDRGELQEDGSFYSVLSYQKEELGISEKTISRSLTELEQLRLVRLERKGMPAKIYYKILDENILKLFNTSEQDRTKCPNKIGQNVQTGEDKMSVHEETNCPVNKNKEIRINNNNKEEKEKRKNHISLLGTFEEKYRNGELYRINLKYNLPYMPDKKDYANYGDLSTLMDDEEILQLYEFFAEGVSTGKFSDCYFSDTPVNLSRMNSYRVDLMALKAKKDKTTNVAYSPPVSPQHSKANQDKYLEYARSLGFNSVDEYLQDRQKRRAG